MNMRKITSMTMLVSLLLLLINSVVLYIVPEGRVAYWADWHLVGLSKTEWGDQHITIGVLFLVASVLHIYFNWAPIVAYMKNKAREIKVFTGSFNVAVLITVLVAVGTYYQIPPMSTVLALGETFKHKGSIKYGEPPYGHAELSSIKLFSKKEGLDAEKAVALMREAGLQVEGAKDTIKKIAKNNKLTPQQVYEIIKPAKKVSALAVATVAKVDALATTFPDHPRPGFGKKSLDEVCTELGLNKQMIVTGLNGMGITCDSSMAIKEIGSANGQEPMEIFEAIRSLVVKD